MAGIVLLAMAWLIFLSYVVRSAWEEATITVPHLQEVTGEELAVQVLVVVMEAVLGSSQLVF
jgi:hypothetical protein